MDNIYKDVVSVSRRELFDVWRKEISISEKNSAVSSYVISKFEGKPLTEDKKAEVKLKINNFNSRLSRKWSDCHRSLKQFLSREATWLEENLTFCMYPKLEKPVAGPSGVKSGRPQKSFDELTHSSKKRRILPLLQQYTKEELILAAQISLRQAGQRDAASIISEATETSPTRATRIKKSWKSPPLQPVKYTPEDALALYIDGHDTKHSYILMQSGAKARHANIYPPYETILKAKKDCYPISDSTNISETSAEIKVQALIDHTIGRLVRVQKEVLFQNMEELAEGLTCIFKWGCDGSSGHPTYSQLFSDEVNNQGIDTDSSLFAICLVPLHVRANKTNKIIWHNLTPSSTRFCRPIKLVFVKETAALIKKEIANVEQQIKDLNSTKILISGQEVVVTSEFKLTMIDGKTFGVISDTSTQSCGICKASPKDMNKLEYIQQRSIDTSKFEYGLSSLHAWIRCFECFLHIAYRLDVKKWQIRSKEDKLIVANRKKRIQNDLKTKLGLLVDVPKPGCGTTNTGNMASRFFEDHEHTSPITGINEKLLHRFHVILQTISCGYAINIVEFRKYTMKTAEKYVSLYYWYNMPSSVHKLLIHGPDIIEAAVLPIGMFSEESLEARNKDFRRFKEYNTRKFSRLQTMTDLLNTLLYTSDPLISSISKSNKIARSYKNSVLDENVNSLLLDPSVDVAGEDISVLHNEQYEYDSE